MVYDPNRAGYGGTLPDQSNPLAAAAYAPQGSPYVGQQTGGVQQGDRNIFDILFGTGKVRVDAAGIPTLSDQPDQASVADANTQYQHDRDQWNQQKQYYTGLVADAVSHMDFDKAKALDAEFKEKYPEPKAPDVNSIQARSDRARLLQLASAGYGPLIAQQLQTAQGKGPSAALATYQTASDNAQRQAYGTAASANVTGGQKAALFQSALGKAAQLQQGAANDAAKIRMQEMQGAQQGLASSLAGASNVVGPLLTDTRGVQDKNVDNQTNANLTNAGYTADDAKTTGAGVRGVLSTAGTATSGGAKALMPPA